MVLRKAVKGEEEKVLSFYYELIDLMKEREYKPSWTKGVYPAMEDIGPAIANAELYLALEDERIIGAFILNRRQGDGYDKVSWTVPAEPGKVSVVHLLAVYPGNHRRGTGTMLLQKIVELCRDRGDDVIRLDTRKGNVPAIRLYEKFGFFFCGNHEMTYPTTGTVEFCIFELKI